MAKPDWITITPASGSNNGSFDVTAAANTGLARNVFNHTTMFLIH